MRKILLLTLLLCLCTWTVSADVIWGPVVYAAWALQHWHVILLVTAIIVITVIIIRMVKK